MAKRVIIVHGWGSVPGNGWKPWLKKELEKRGFTVANPAMPDTNNPKRDAWVAFIHKVVGKPDKDTYLVGHSLGCTAILRYLETLKGREQVGGTLLVAGPVSLRENPEVASFFAKPFGWSRIKARCRQFAALYSVDDYYVPLQHAGVLKRRLNAELIIKYNMRHFSNSDGITKLPDGLKALLKMAK